MAAKVTGAAKRQPARQSRPAAAPLGPAPRNAEEAAALRQQVRMLSGGDPEAVLEPDVFEFEPVRLTSAPAEAQQVTLFYVDDQPFTIQATARMDLGLEAIDVLTAEGGAAAERYLLAAFLGEDEFAAFRENIREPADYRKIVAILTRLSMGAVEAPKAASG